ncbi:serine hydrolase domain-containing protein [Hyphobacterium sp.]|uniref:serine hydrolase domain-containing protein n=1 Tax=Hyphobacterium sp. TaxID=2004662 RepID=UPI003BA9B837
MLRIAVLLAVITSSAVAARQDVQALADGLIENGSPGAVVMLIDGDTQLISVAGDRRSSLPSPIELEDQWHLGSNTKAMTAMLAARLVEQGAMGWDTTLGESLGERFNRIDPVLADATLAELLQHRSGMVPNAGRLTSIAISGLFGERDAARDRIPYLRELLRDPAGQRGTYLYSNAGYVAAALMMEQATGETWEALIQRELFDPLGLESAGFGPPQGEQPQGHNERGERLIPAGTGAGADNPPAVNPAGRVHMSMPDYAVFLRLVIAGARGEETEYLSAESWQALLTPPAGADYAMGWGVGEDGSLRHAGSNTMWFVQAVIWPEANRMAVAGVNEGRISVVVPEIRDVVSELSPD